MPSWIVRISFVGHTYEIQICHFHGQFNTNGDCSELFNQALQLQVTHPFFTLVNHPDSILVYFQCAQWCQVDLSFVRHGHLEIFYISYHYMEYVLTPCLFSCTQYTKNQLIKEIIVFPPSLPPSLPSFLSCHTCLLYQLLVDVRGIVAFKLHDNSQVIILSCKSINYTLHSFQWLLLFGLTDLTLQLR